VSVVWGLGRDEMVEVRMNECCSLGCGFGMGTLGQGLA
jgi:hypothetical protein